MKRLVSISLPFFWKWKKAGNPDVSLLTANALQLPFADEIFDAVVGFEFIEHVHDVPALLDEMIRVVKVRGHIIIHSPNLLSPYLPAYDLLRLMQGGKGRPVFAETIPQARDWFKQNMRLSIKKWFSPPSSISLSYTGFIRRADRGRRGQHLLGSSNRSGLVYAQEWLRDRSTGPCDEFP